MAHKAKNICYLTFYGKFAGPWIKDKASDLGKLGIRTKVIMSSKVICLCAGGTGNTKMEVKRWRQIDSTNTDPVRSALGKCPRVVNIR